MIRSIEQRHATLRIEQAGIRDMNKDVSWETSARQYKDMYVELTPR